MLRLVYSYHLFLGNIQHAIFFFIWLISIFSIGRIKKTITIEDNYTETVTLNKIHHSWQMYYSKWSSHLGPHNFLTKSLQEKSTLKFFPKSQQTQDHTDFTERVETVIVLKKGSNNNRKYIIVSSHKLTLFYWQGSEYDDTVISSTMSGHN